MPCTAWDNFCWYLPAEFFFFFQPFYNSFVQLADKIGHTIELKAYYRKCMLDITARAYTDNVWQKNGVCK